MGEAEHSQGMSQGGLHPGIRIRPADQRVIARDGTWYLMTVWQRGGKTYVDLVWQGPRIFSANNIPSSVASYAGVYLISSPKGLYSYPSGRSSLAYIGRSEEISRRLGGHVSGGNSVADLLGACSATLLEP